MTATKPHRTPTSKIAFACCDSKVPTSQINTIGDRQSARALAVELGAAVCDDCYGRL